MGNEVISGKVSDVKEVKFTAGKDKEYIDLLAESIQKNLDNIKYDYIMIAGKLNDIKSHVSFKKSDYAGDIYAFAKERFALCKTTVKNLLSVFDRYSNQYCLASGYYKYNYTQLVEMLPFKREDENKVLPSMTVKEIRLLKKQLYGSQLTDQVEKFNISVVARPGDTVVVYPIENKKGYRTKVSSLSIHGNEEEQTIYYILQKGQHGNQGYNAGDFYVWKEAYEDPTHDCYIDFENDKNYIDNLPNCT